MAKRVFLLHGWEGSPHSNWLPWLKSRLEEQKIKVSVPALPDPYNPKLDFWLDTLSKTVGNPDENIYLVGHSLGCITILRYLENLKKGQIVGGVILVAGFTDDLGVKKLNNFYTTPIDWDAINLHCTKFVVIASDDDKYVPLRYSDILKENLKAKVIIEHNMDHFIMEELPIVLNQLVEMINNKATNTF